jgi:hypothetical protein
MSIENKNRVENPTKKSKLTPEELRAKRESMLKNAKRIGLSAGLGALTALAINLPSFGSEQKGGITPDMQPNPEHVQTQSGAELDINPSVEGTFDQNAIGNVPENFQNQAEIDRLNELTKTPEGRAQITDGPYDDVPDLQGPMRSNISVDKDGVKTDIGEPMDDKGNLIR